MYQRALAFEACKKEMHVADGVINPTQGQGSMAHLAVQQIFSRGPYAV